MILSVWLGGASVAAAQEGTGTATTAAESDEAVPAEAAPADDAGASEATARRRRKTGGEAAIENLIVTGTKKPRGQELLEVPAAVSVVGEDQLEAFQFRDLESLSFSLPNVSLDAVGTVKGIANFTIRGLGANSSIPSIDPTVGVFVNGVYLGTNFGAVLDTFDLEAVEVLRGPQGILFGRNVTGGAILLRTKRPGDTPSASIKTNFETGLEYRLYGAFESPIVEDLIKVRVAGQYRNDDGWFTNQAPVAPFNPAEPQFRDEEFGEEESWLVRPTVTLTPHRDFTVHVMYEHGETEGQGPASQFASRTGVNNPMSPIGVGPFDDFDFSIDERGFVDYYYNQVFVEAVWDIAPNHQIVDIFGWRNVLADSASDIDAQPIILFTAGAFTEATHWSNELRYSGRLFDDLLDLTIGLYAFSQEIIYRERRLIPSAMLDTTFGGDQDQLSLGAFSQLEFNLTDEVTTIFGGRVTYETKDALIASLNPVSPCTLNAQDCSNYDFDDDEDWLNFSPKIGAQWMYMPDNQVYGHWTRGFRGGGYNMRNTSPTASPGPFDEETQDSFEVGLKGQVFDNKLRYGLAGYFMRVVDLQREVNEPDQVAQVVQVIRNAGDANFYGFEAEATARILPELTVYGTFGYTDAAYTEVREDLNGDMVVDARDEDLTIPRLENISATVGAIADFSLGSAGLLTLRGNYAYRDDSFFTDNNLGRLPSGHVVDASVAFTLPDITMGVTALVPKVTLYGRNLLNEAFLGGQTVLPFGNFSPLKEGRVLGAELRIDWL